ncbi:MAG TPA: glycosyltransferase family 4 protein, partial [Duganella sp.]|uniref:glycosyltransferase family 4 protein n=1 Tax=Duganella sp. TaxID=1904440 RepID=UPI002ED1A99E
MNILLINHYAGSVRHGMEYRPYYLARAWVRAGHRVRIVAASSSHLRAAAPALDGRRVADEIIDGIEYRWHAAPAYRGNGLGRAANMAAFIGALYRGAAALARDFRPDLVIASSTYPADIWPARRIAALAGARLAFEVHDLWPLSPMELGGMPAWHPFIALMQAAEDYAYRHADTVISILPHAGAHMAARGMAPHKLHVVPNGVDPDEWDRAPVPLPAPAAALLDALRDEGRTVVGYAGSHGLANALDTLLDAAALLRGRPLAFVLAGAGPDKKALQRKAAAAGLCHVHFLDPLAKRHMPALLRRFDLAYLGWRRQPLYRFGISPNKLGDYMMAARPIIHAVEAANDPVAEAGCGVSVAPAAPAALAAAIARLAA